MDCRISCILAALVFSCITGYQLEVRGGEKRVRAPMASSSFSVGSGRSAPIMRISEQCSFPDLIIPPATKIFAGGAYSGRKLDIQIDDSGDQATLMEVVVNEPKYPVILILGNYEPTIWHFSWTQGTEIIAVVIGGYHTQKVIGLPEDVPVRIGSYEDDKCWSFYFGDSEKLKVINSLSEQLFKRKPDKGFIPVMPGRLIIGLDSFNDTDLITARKFDEKKFAIPGKPLAGREGIREAINKNLIRPANREIIDTWRDKYNERQGIDNLANKNTGFQYTSYDRAYEVISNDFIIPAGLYGANSVHFYIPEGIDIPRGEPGHCTIFLLKDGSCLGASPGCTMLR